jgi:hypothetical protein
MIKNIKTVFLAVILTTSCQNISKKVTSASTLESPSKTGVSSDKFIGSWVQPNPINEKEVQGFVLKNDGTAESINMETLKYKKWWYEANKLNLVSESIGNRTSSMDTIKYEIVKINDKELELKEGQFIKKYKKQ